MTYIGNNKYPFVRPLHLVAHLESSFVKTDNAALAQDAAILGPMAEATNATCKISPNFMTKKDCT
jgi:hypothetical protein